MNESDSDESIREIKKKHTKKQVAIDLFSLSDHQIGRLNLQQIDNLLVKVQTFCEIAKERHEEILNTNYLSDSELYTGGMHFGELSLIDNNNVRSGTARCSTDCMLLTLTKDDYNRLIARMLVQ